MLDVVVDSWTWLIKVTGMPVDPWPLAIATVGVVVSGKILWTTAKSRREFRRIADELKKSTVVISDHMRTEFDGQVDQMSKLQASVQRTLNRRFRGVDDKFEALHALLKPTVGLRFFSLSECLH